MEIVVLCTTPNKAEATLIAGALVEARLAACVNIIDGVHSIFFWEGRIEEEKEHIMIIKTTQELFERVKVEIKSLHSYELPEIIALPITMGSSSYLEWIRNSCSA